jgi:hypothetical protein
MANKPFSTKMVRYIAGLLWEHRDEIRDMLDLDDEQFEAYKTFLGWIISHGLEG